jgi:hypothetical protein
VACETPEDRRRAAARRIAPRADLPAEAEVWGAAGPALEIAHFRPESTDHRPRTTLQLLHDERALYGLFRVADRYVRCRHTAFGDPVYRDSCVEFFAQPKPGLGYFNFEFNCGGALLCFYITDPTRIGGAFKEYRKLSAGEAQGMEIRASLPAVVEPERTEPLAWWLAFRLPVAVMEPFVGPRGELSGQQWRVNAYKCGNETSHRHWAAWAPVDELNFHRPDCFGHLVFE